MRRQELSETWVGKTVDVVIEQVEPENNKIIGSIRTAIRYRHARNMQVSPAALHPDWRQSDLWSAAQCKPDRSPLNALALKH